MCILSMSIPHEMTTDEALQRLALSRKTDWPLPHFAGPPSEGRSRRPSSGGVQKKKPFVEAARFLLDKRKQDLADEMAANVWRLWVLSRDDDNGRQFLGRVLDNGPRRISRARALALYGDSLLGPTENPTSIP